MSIRNEPTSALLEKYILILIEVQRLNAQFIHYSNAGPQAKVAEVADFIKRLELSKKTIALEIDKRMPNDNEETDLTGSGNIDSPPA